MDMKKPSPPVPLVPFKKRPGDRHPRLGDFCAHHDLTTDDCECINKAIAAGGQLKRQAEFYTHAKNMTC